MATLAELVEQYGENKSKFDALKKLCDSQNKKIKKLMSDSHINDFESDSYVASYYTQNRTEFNSDKALEIVKRSGLTQCIKTVEILDEDMLESMLYSKLIPQTVIQELNTCYTRKSVPALKISMRKEPKND